MPDISLSRGRSTHARGRRALALPLLVVTLGALSGLAAVGLFAGAASGDANDRPSLDPGRLIDAAHLPPLLTAAGEPVELRYDIYCTAPDGDPDSGAPCDGGGTVYARAGAQDRWEAFPLTLDPAAEGRYVTRVPDRIAAQPAGFSYYAVLRNRRTGVSTTLPAGGAAAPQRSVPLAAPTRVQLGRHTFGDTVRPEARLFSARWGAGVDEVGLEGGDLTTPIGPSAFDVDAGGTVSLLDQVNRRLLRVAPGGARPTAVSVAVDGTLADMSVDTDGTAYVLESTGRAAGEPPLLRVFDRAGRGLGTIELAERTASQVRVGPEGPVVKHYPSELWRPARRAQRTLTRAEQLAAGSPARALRDGREVVVSNRGNELRIALGRPGARRTWVIESDTPLGEVQLAEPLGSRVVVVLRVYTDVADEFVALVLGPRGLERRLSLASEDWAETAPLTRFRVAGTSLYRLGSTPAGINVDRFDLGVRR